MPGEARKPSASILPRHIVVMGASAGGLPAFGKVLRALPNGFPWPVLVVQYIHRDASGYLANYIKNQTGMYVIEAIDKMVLQSGVVYVAPGNYHLLVENKESLALSVDTRVSYSRPSIDVLFQSAAEVYGGGVTGVVLTGGNSDGAKGARCIMLCGGRILVQDPSEAEADAMPKAALDSAPGAEILPLDAIGPRLVMLARQSNEWRIPAKTKTCADDPKQDDRTG